MLATLSKISIIDPNLPTGIIGKPIAEIMQIEWVNAWINVKQACFTLIHAFTHSICIISAIGFPIIPVGKFGSIIEILDNVASIGAEV